MGRDIYLRHTDTNGRRFVQCHRVWDAERFITARQADAAKANADAKDGPELLAMRVASVEQITEEQYRNERKTQ